MSQSPSFKRCLVILTQFECAILRGRCSKLICPKRAGQKQGAAATRTFIPMPRNGVYQVASGIARRLITALITPAIAARHMETGSRASRRSCGLAEFCADTQPSISAAPSGFAPCELGNRKPVDFSFELSICNQHVDAPGAVHKVQRLRTCACGEDFKTPKPSSPARSYGG